MCRRALLASEHWRLVRCLAEMKTVLVLIALGGLAGEADQGEKNTGGKGG